VITTMPDEPFGKALRDRSPFSGRVRPGAGRRFRVAVDGFYEWKEVGGSHSRTGWPVRVANALSLFRGLVPGETVRRPSRSSWDGKNSPVATQAGPLYDASLPRPLADLRLVGPNARVSRYKKAPAFPIRNRPKSLSGALPLATICAILWPVAQQTTRLRSVRSPITP